MGIRLVMRIERGARRFAAGLLLVSVAVACGPSVPSSDIASAASPAARPSELPAEIAEAIAFRKQYGLSADEEWVRAVAVDPAAQAAINEFGVPLTPAERADLLDRRFDLGTFEDVLAYGRLFPQDYAGAYLDQATTGIVVSFKNRVDQHRRAMTNLFPKAANIDVRKVEWSTADLDGFADLINQDRAWFDTLGVRFISADRSILDNFVTVHYQGPQEAAALIEAHFGNPSWAKAESAGNLPWTGPRGDLVLTVTDRQGRPVPEIWCDFFPENPLANEGGEVVYATGPDGQCLIPNLPAVAYGIVLKQFVDNHYQALTRVRAVVVPGDRTVLPVRLP